MRRWTCDVCRHRIRFEDFACGHCGSSLGYLPDELRVGSVVAVDDVTYHPAGSRQVLWRCLNAAYGCNWMLAADSGGVWCRSCRLTRGRPDDARPDAVAAWSTTEAAKRRLVHQLDDLQLAVDIHSSEQSDGLMFDLVYLDDGGVTTGYSAGIVTLDLSEADERHREHVRRELGESFRTVIGHLRHEAGHHYFHRLVTQSDDLAEFRALFGHTEIDYADALATHYSTDSGWNPELHITAYATAHPLEDWAETFAHYLHIRDASETAEAHGLSAPLIDRVVADDRDFAHLLDSWQSTIDAVNEIAESLGLSAVYPFALSGRVTDKLRFVHDQIAKNSQRRDFYAAE